MKGKEKNDLERFKEYPQQITPPPGLDASAARLTEELYGKKAAEKKERRARLVRRRLLPSLAILLVLLIPLCIGIPGMLTLDDEEGNYYLGEELTVDLVKEDVKSFMLEHGVNGYFFDGDNILQSSVAAHYLKKENRIMFLIQDVLFLSDSGLDSISLGIVFTNDTFEQFNDFVDLPEETQIAGVEVDYKTETANGMDVVRSRFSYEQVSYFLEITTISADGVLEQYITELLS